MADIQTRAKQHTLGELVEPASRRVLNPESLSLYGGLCADAPVLVILAAGKGTRFGHEPKCIQPVHGTPLARHSIDAFRRFSSSPVICLVGYRHQQVAAALGADVTYVLSDDPAGGTAYATMEAFSVPGLLDADPLLIVSMGDRIVPPSTFCSLWETHCAGDQEATITFLTAIYEAPKQRGKGRVVRDAAVRVLRIIEERDIARVHDEASRHALLALDEGNCPLYAVRASTLHAYLGQLTNDNAQRQYYLTDIIEAISADGGAVRTITTRAGEPAYDLLCADVTRPQDLAMLEGILATSTGLPQPDELATEAAADLIARGRPAGQVASIARQLQELMATAEQEGLGFRPDQPVAIGISGGRLRIACMHPDMARFYGPAWQMPIGAGHAEGGEQIVTLVQETDDGFLHLFPTNPDFRECVNDLPCDDATMYPDDEVADWHAYEAFGTRLSESLLLSLGYFSDEELAQRRRNGQPLPPSSLWAGSNMRRPFALVGNALASLRTLRAGTLGARVQERLGKEHFRGLRLACTGNIPQGGFSSSSAVTLATKNAINALFRLGIPPDLLVHLACQAEFGTGVRGGSLDQATEQKGQAGLGTLISSNPRDNYRVIGAYPVPTDRFRVIYPYSVERDREAWRWSWGGYGRSGGQGPLTAGEMRKLTGKAAEIAAVLTRLPLETDFFREVEDDLVADGLLTVKSRRWTAGILRGLPLRAIRAELKERVDEQREWYVQQLMTMEHLERGAAERKAEGALDSLWDGWRDPILRRTTLAGEVVTEVGVPRRAMVAYLFGEVTKNLYLVHHPAEWIACVGLSQRGDRCVTIDPQRLPSREAMERALDWERGLSGPALMERWLERFGAIPFDYNQGLDDDALSAPEPPAFHQLEGSGFFRGLALIDLAEAMLIRAFGERAVAVRVNAAGQGDYFQVHVDTERADPEAVKAFLQAAFYRRFGLSPDPPFVELFPGGGAVGVRLGRFDALPRLVERLRAPSGPRSDLFSERCVVPPDQRAR